MKQTLRKLSRGLTMIELLVGLAIGSMVIVGAVMVYSQTRTTYSINESVARLQENGRYVFAVLEPDIQLAGYYGYVNDPAALSYYTSSSSITPSTSLDLGDSQLSGTPAATHTCGNNFGINVWWPVEGSNDSFGLPSACNPATGTFIANTDRLTIRRASTVTSAAPNAQLIQIYGDRLNVPLQKMFASSTTPAPLDTNHVLRNLLVRTYFLTNASSTVSGTIPTLWRKSIGVNGSGNSAMIDEEILPGVEDFQVEFAIDTGDHDGVAGFDVNSDAEPLVPDSTNGVIGRWVNPGDSSLSPPPTGMRAQVVAVRVWLMMRAETSEVGFNDASTYSYAGRTYDPPTAVEGFRRTLMSRTIFLRNARFY